MIKRLFSKIKEGNEFFNITDHSFLRIEKGFHCPPRLQNMDTSCVKTYSIELSKDRLSFMESHF